MASSLTSNQLSATNVAATNVYSSYYHLGNYTIGDYSKFRFSDISSVTVPYTPSEDPNEGDVWVFKVSGSEGYLTMPSYANGDHFFVWIVKASDVPGGAEGICFFHPDKVTYWLRHDHAHSETPKSSPSGFFVNPTSSGGKILGPYGATYYVLMYKLYDD